MARQYFIPGFGFINDPAGGREYFIPGLGAIYEEGSSDVAVDCSVVNLTLTENQANINAAVNVQADTDSLIIATFNASVKLNISVNASLAALSLTENKAQITHNINLQANVDTLSLTEFNAAVTLNVGISAAVENLVLQTHKADVNIDVSIQANVANLALTANAANIKLDRTILAALASLALTEYAANINAAINVQARRDILRITTYPVSLFPEYGDWRDDVLGEGPWACEQSPDFMAFKGEGVWPFVEQQNKWGYLNNPRWQTTPQPRVNYSENIEDEPQVWSLPDE